MPSVCFYFQVHQPYRLKEFTFFDIGHHVVYANEELNKAVLNKVADKCYLKANAVLLDLIKRHNGRFKVTFSLSGVFLEQIAACRQDVLESFQSLAATGCVEFLSETYYHSLASVHSEEEFVRQIDLHKELIQKYFNQTPRSFRNTELIYSNGIAQKVDELGYKAILCEGIEQTLNGQHPDQVLKASGTKKMKVLCRNYKFSDDIAFRFSNTSWGDYPLTPAKFSSWLHNAGHRSDVFNLFMDYETFGEHQWEDSGILGFLNSFPDELLKESDWDFRTVSEIADIYPATHEVNCTQVASWADTERDLSAWEGNGLQQQAITAVYELEEKVQAKKDPALLAEWGNLQISDHFYYMSTKHFNDGAVHSYFSPFKSPYDAYLAFMNIISDFEVKLKQ